MGDNTIMIQPSRDDETGVEYVVDGDGIVFRLGFSRQIVEIWEEQLSRADNRLDLSAVAQELAEELARQTPRADQLAQGFLVTIDNGFATPTAAAHNLRNSGVGAFVVAPSDVPSPPPPAMSEHDAR